MFIKLLYRGNCFEFLWSHLYLPIFPKDTGHRHNLNTGTSYLSWEEETGLPDTKNVLLAEEDKLVSTDSANDSKAPSDANKNLNLAKLSFEEGSSKSPLHDVIPTLHHW